MDVARRRGGPPALSSREKLAGGVLLVCYLTVFPLYAGPVFDLAAYLLGAPIGSGLRDALYHGALFALTLAVFRDLWRRATGALLENAGRVFSALGLGLAGFYGLGSLSAKLLRLLPVEAANRNDAAISAQLGTSPGSTILIVVLLAPVVEETLFRGYVFGGLRRRSRAAAYLASCLLWALAHVWQHAAAGDWSYLLAAAQYLGPGLALAWTCERAGSLWGSVLLHALANALAVWKAL